MTYGDAPCLCRIIGRVDTDGGTGRCAGRELAVHFGQRGECRRDAAIDPERPVQRNAAALN
jgi:hypothetical protein